MRRLVVLVAGLVGVAVLMRLGHIFSANITQLLNETEWTWTNFAVWALINISSLGGVFLTGVSVGVMLYKLFREEESKIWYTRFDTLLAWTGILSIYSFAYGVKATPWHYGKHPWRWLMEDMPFSSKVGLLFALFFLALILLHLALEVWQAVKKHEQQVLRPKPDSPVVKQPLSVVDPAKTA